MNIINATFNFKTIIRIEINIINITFNIKTTLNINLLIP